MEWIRSSSSISCVILTAYGAWTRCNAERMNRDMRIQSTVSFMVLGVALSWSGPALCALIYKAEAIEGWVVDSETGKPIEGVVVVAHWQLQGGFEGGTPLRELKIFEAVTDHSGHYSFPAWGPEI